VRRAYSERPACTAGLRTPCAPDAADLLQPHCPGLARIPDEWIRPAGQSGDPAREGQPVLLIWVSTDAHPGGRL